VDAVKIADEILKQQPHLPLVSNEIHKLARASSLGYEHVLVDELTNFEKKVIKLIVPIQLDLPKESVRCGARAG
jgi:hypothetical protein